MTILKGHKVKGIISLPNGEKAENSIEIKLGFNTEGYYDCYKSVLMQAGSDSIYYELYLPESSEGYKVNLDVIDGSGRYDQDIFYNKHKLVKEYNQASSIRINKNINVNITLTKNY